VCGLLLRALNTGQAAPPLTKTGINNLLTHARLMVQPAECTRLHLNGQPSSDPLLSPTDHPTHCGMLTMMAKTRSVTFPLLVVGSLHMLNSTMVTSLYAVLELTRTMLHHGTKLPTNFTTLRSLTTVQSFISVMIIATIT